MSIRATIARNLRFPSRARRLRAGPLLFLYAILAFALLLALFWAPCQRLLAGRVPGVGSDFLALSVGGEVVRDGNGGRLYDVAAQAHAQATLLSRPGSPGNPEQLALYLYPPFVAAAFAALDGLTPGVAFGLWACLNLAALLFALWAVGRAAGSRRVLLYLVPAILTFLPIWMVLLRGQVAFLAMAALAGCYLALSRNQDELAGACLAAGLAKPQLVIVPALALLMARRPRAILGFGLGAIVLVAASLAVTGPAGLAGYGRLLIGAGQDTAANSLVHPAWMYNWRGTSVRALGLLSPDGFAPGLATAVYGLLDVATLALLGQAWRRLERPTSSQLAGLWALSILAGVLVSPHLQEYDLALWLLAGALIALYYRAWEGGALSPAWRWLLLAAHALPTLLLALVVLPMGLAWSAQIGVICTCVMAGALWRALMRTVPTHLAT